MASGGYDYDFVEELPNEYTCVICCLALKDPKQIQSCGHRFCEPCYVRYCDHNSSSDTVNCPIDREPFEDDQVFSDTAAERAILNLNVKCTNHSKGCPWIGILKNAENHQMICEKASKRVSDEDNRKEIEELKSALSQKSDELSAVKQTVAILETRVAEKSAKLQQLSQEFAIKTEKLFSVEIQLKQLSEDFKEFKIEHSDQKKESPIVSSEDPRTLNLVSNKFEWICPLPNDTGVDHFSPCFYYKQFCFQLSLYLGVDDADDTFDMFVSLYRSRGKFDSPFHYIKDHMPENFGLVVTLGGDGIVFKRNIWSIGVGYVRSKEEYYSIKIYEDFYKNGFVHLEFNFEE